MTIKVQCIGEPAEHAQSFEVPSYLTWQQLLDHHISNSQVLTQIYNRDGARLVRFQLEDIKETKEDDNKSPSSMDLSLSMHQSIQELPLRLGQVVWLVYSKPSSSKMSLKVS